ncbi:MAG: hypothetical protein HY895_14395 [Deltaproteobacteria bacterium]|nr:hypothetical protein [Deltaproteobacteria bacterium]
MLIIPTYQPIVEGLNSYYLNVRKFFEHHQRELGTCGIHLKSPRIEGIVYFDSGQFLSATCLTNTGTISGKEAIEWLTSAVEKHNFSVSVYQIDPEMIFFWANALHAKPLHRDLTTDITELDRLIAKMINQQLTGFIEVLIADGSASGILFFNDGKIVSASTNSGKISESVELVRSRLVEQTKAKGGTFHVSMISTHEENEENPPKKTESSASPTDAVASPAPSGNGKMVNLLPMLEEILGLSESVCIESKRVNDFQTQFRKAAMELTDKYNFLDPFLKEFEYSAGKVRLEDTVDPKVLVAGVLECIQKMLAPLGLTEHFKAKAEGWFRANGETLKSLGVK